MRKHLFFKLKIGKEYSLTCFVLKFPGQLFIYSKTLFIGILTYRNLATSFIGTFCFSSSHHSLYIVTQFPDVSFAGVLLCQFFYIPSFVFLSSFSIMKNQINLHNLQIHYNLCTRALFALYITITQCQHTTRVMATHHETVGGSRESLQIPINEVFTFQGRPNK